MHSNSIERFGMRALDIPTVLARFVQQAMLQLLQPRIESTFAPHSYGLRPGVVRKR